MQRIHTTSFPRAGRAALALALMTTQPFVGPLPQAAAQNNAPVAPQTAPGTAQTQPQRPTPDALTFTIREADKGTFDVDAEQQDAVTVLKAFAAKASVNLALVGTPNAKTSVTLRKTTPEQAIRLIALSAGLASRKSGDNNFLVGSAADIQNASNTPGGDTTMATYTCRHIAASTLVNTLQGIFDQQLLKVTVGPTYLTPSLDATTAVEMDGDTSGGPGGRPLQATDATMHVFQIVISGDAELVQQALDLCKKLDHRRGQVKIKVKIMDIALDSLKETGIQWNWNGYTANEVPGSDATNTNATPQVNNVKVGRFSHDPLSLSATLSALETNGQAKMLAEPTLSCISGERSFILIGQKLVFPKLVTNTYTGQPIYDTQEVRVGIYVQIAVQIGDDGDIVLSLYPQVSAITDFLNVNGASYPIITTREQQTTIRARNGETIAVGGLIRDEEIKNAQKVPFLSKIPILGELFTYRKRTRSRDELMIMITPEIIEENESDAKPAASSPGVKPAPVANPQK